MTDLDSTIIYWNRFAETVYGWSSAEALGRNIGELLVPEASKADSQDIMPRLLRGQSWSGEFVVRRRDGTSFPCLVTDSPLQDASGKLVGVIGVSFDNSARKQAEEAQARLAAIVTCSEDAIIATSLDGTITDWNEGATALHGYTAVEMIGRPVSLLSPPEYAAETSNRRARIVAGESFEHVETVRLHKDGRRLDLSVSITPIRAASGAIVGVARRPGRNLWSIGLMQLGRHPLKRRLSSSASAATSPPMRSACSTRPFAGAIFRSDQVPSKPQPNTSSSSAAQ